MPFPEGLEEVLRGDGGTLDLAEVGDGGTLDLEEAGDGGTRSAGCEYEGARRDEEGVRGSVCDSVADITATTRAVCRECSWRAG